ncbi:MAG: phosphotransferase [Pseudomonadota bacterium]
MAGTDMPLEELLGHLEILANDALGLWEMPGGARARLINVSENATYMVEAEGGYKAVLRVHRENYHTRRAIECELEWIRALAADGVVTTPGYYLGKDRRPIQEARAAGLADLRFLVLFHFVEGAAPDESGDLTHGFEELGAIAARMHDHVRNWRKPANFERLVWDDETVFGPEATWGNWRDAPNVTDDMRAELEKLEATVRQRLNAYGKGPERYDLIHADMRLANLLVDGHATRLIDFDDCGHGWFMYDFAAAISFIETSPAIPDLKAAWVKGYRSVRDLSAEDEAEIDTLVMLRRMALLAWIGSHIEAPEPQEMAPHFAAGTMSLAKAYLAKFGN